MNKQATGNPRAIQRLISSLLKFKVIVMLCIMISGCVAGSGGDAIDSILYTYKKFNPPIQNKLTVGTGEYIFAEGAYIEGESITVDSAIDLMIPGAMFIPFPVKIEPGELTLTKIDSIWKYYCADEGKAFAWFPGLGSVIRPGDCVGIRRGLRDSRSEWVVDNSIYNNLRRATIWSKSINEDEAKKYVPIKTNIPFKVITLKRISYDGYYKGGLHFTWEEISRDNKEPKQFTFDFEGQPTIIAIKGCIFRVFHADNSQLQYEWISFKTN